MRLQDLSPDTDARVGILERGLANLNNGQGLGFAFGRVVIDTSALKELGLKMIGLLCTIVPLIWAWRAAAEGKQHHCSLSNDDAKLWQGFAAKFDANCTYRYEIGPGGVTPIN